MAARPALAIASLILLAGSLVLLWFVILSGITRTSPLRQTYFLRADTAGITGARSITQWAYFRICGLGNTDCSRSYADPPFGRAWSANPANAPASLVGSHGGHTTSKHYFYLWRFGWVFFIITLFFETLAFFASFIGCCGRLGAAVSGLVAMTALFFHTLAVSLMTATFVQARNAFHRAGRSASLGKWAFGFSWGSWFALFLATVLLCMGTAGRKDHDAVAASSGSRWRRRRSTRSEYSGRRVKDEYP
ncbi:hypothetical protein VTK73DRAFT_2820 [Phialemonium thermophilum]|uniref:Uncharacterized protein n=1 Tax=Phialemonium thermophilum TaxID=223376 RepID=A0ABR3X2R1_9PEZI